MSKMIKFGIIGYGKMGKTIEKLAVEKGHEVVFKSTKDWQEGTLKIAEVADRASIALNNLSLFIDKTTDDLFIIWTGGAVILLVLKLIWKPLFASTVNYELAEAEGLNPDRAKAIFTILMAAVIAISIKMVGLLLITGMLIIPAAMARNISDSPQKMVLFSIIGGLLSVLLGLFSSLEFNTSSGPSIIMASLILFIFSLLNIKQSIKLKN